VSERDHLGAVVLLFLFGGTIPSTVAATAAADTVLQLDVLLLNATEDSFKVADRCDQSFIAWCPDCPVGSALNTHVLIDFRPTNPERCITERQARTGIVLRATLRRTMRCDQRGEDFSTWGYATRECIDRKSWSSDCWEERSIFLPLTNEGLSLKQIENERFACWEMLDYEVGRLPTP
jgi:hypothetical protein